MKRIMKLLVAVGLLSLASPPNVVATVATAPILKAKDAGSLPTVLLQMVIDQSLNALNQATGEQLSSRDWTVKYHNGSLTITQLQKETFRLDAGGGNIIITILDP